MKIVSKVLSLSILVALLSFWSCSSVTKTQNNQKQTVQININSGGSGEELVLTLLPGNAHNHPSFAIWAETMEEEFIQTLFVTRSVGTGYYGHGPIGDEKWDSKAGIQSRPASLPYWLHKRLPSNVPFTIPTPDKPIPDAYTGATPAGQALINVRADKPLPRKFRILLEVNQPWDWNSFWTNTKYDDPDYRTSCQPSLIYAVSVDLDKANNTLFLNPIGHGHYAGKTGELFTDITTITTARDIFPAAQLTTK